MEYDSWSSLAPYLINMTYCPQLEMMLHILIGESNKVNGFFSLNRTIIYYCFHMFNEF